MNTTYCPVCGTQVPQRTYQGGTPKKYCSRTCQKSAANQRYDAKYPEKRLDRQSKYGRSDKGKNVQKRKRLTPDYAKKREARDAVRRAIAKGVLVKPPTCQWCLEKKRVEAHHYRGYEYPLAVQWLCSKCHRKFG